MKKFRFLFAFALATMLVLVACSKEEVKTNTSETSKGKVQLTAKVSSGSTKVHLGEKVGSTYPILWDDPEQAIVLSEILTPTSGDMSYNNYGGEATTVSADKKSATFKFELNELTTEGTYDYYAVYPFKALQGVSTQYKDLNVYIPEVQTPKPTSPDPNAIVYYAESKGHTSQQTSLTLNFSHPMCAFGRVTIKNPTTPIGAGETIQQVEISVPTGGYYWYWETNTFANVSGKSHETVLLQTNELTTTSDFDVWFTCKMCNRSAGEKLIVSIITDQEKYTRVITLTSDITFNGGKVSHFTVDMATAAVEDFSGNYLIGSTDSDAHPIYLMTKNLNATNQLIGENSGVTVAQYVSLGVAAFDAYCVSDYVWVLNKVPGGYTLMNNESGKYVDWVDGNTVTLSDVATVLSVSRGGGDDELVVKKGSDRSLQYNYNGGNTRFAFYTSTQKELHFVPVTTIKTNIDAPTNFDASVSGTTITATWTDTPSGVDHYVVGCTGQTPQNIAPGTQTASFTSLANGTYEVTIYAVPTDNTTYARSVTLTKSDLVVGTVPTLFKTFTASGIGSGYSAHTGVTSDGLTWTITFGQGTYIGTNSSKKANCMLGDTYAKVGTPCGYTGTTTQVTAVISESTLENIAKVVVDSDTDNANNNPQKISLVYSTDNTTYTLVETQNYNQAAGNTFTFAKKAAGYYAVVLYHDGSESKFLRTNNLKIKFYKLDD